MAFVGASAFSNAVMAPLIELADPESPNRVTVSSAHSDAGANGVPLLIWCVGRQWPAPVDDAIVQA